MQVGQIRAEAPAFREIGLAVWHVPQALGARAATILTTLPELLTAPKLKLNGSLLFVILRRREVCDRSRRRLEKFHGSVDHVAVQDPSPIL